MVWIIINGRAALSIYPPGLLATAGTIASTAMGLRDSQTPSHVDKGEKRGGGEVLVRDEGE